MAKSASDSPLLFDLQPEPDFAIEAKLIAKGYSFIAGIDEAGRGPLAGPVVAAAVILDPNNIPEGLNDSKKLTAAKREALFTVILTSSRAVGLASLCATSIDETDIRKAALEAMRRATEGLPIRIHHALIDGRDVPPGLHCPGTALVKGDQRSVSIAAASIVAKVTRDRMMERAATAHPAYGWEKHAGYGTAAHRKAMEIHGPVERIHRFSFAPLKNRI
ncbi:MAG: ribonuclease HII [Phyllobacterium sp.]